MSVRRLLLAVSSFALLLGPSATTLRAQDAGSVEMEASKHNFIGVISGNNVFVRSAPREDGNPTMKLNKGDKITVVGIKFKWLKILPPEGSFAYVPKAYVNKRGDGSVGRATRESVAKAGSTLNTLKTAPMGKVEEGQDVEIIGEQDEFYKIKPPAGSFLYVNESFVELLKTVPNDPKDSTVAAGNGTKPPVPTAPRPAPPSPNESVPSGPLKTETPQPGTASAGPTTAPSEAVATAPELFEKLETEFKAASEHPITDQPVDTLLTGYSELLKLDGLTAIQKKVSENRVATLKLRTQAKAEFIASQQEQRLAADRQKSLNAEREEIKERIKEKQVTFFAAVGTLRPSSIQHGSGTLFRLTDPSTGRTVAYLRSLDSKYASLLGQFVGVKGTITTDPALNMKIIESPTGAEAVDSSKVNDSIIAQIVPPSLVPGTRTARNSD